MTEDRWPPRLLEPSDHFIDTKQPDYHLNACVGRQLSEDHGPLCYSNGFRSAAHRLVEDLIERPALDLPVDRAVYPVVFLYRHHLELLLKLLIVASRQALSEDGDSPSGHQLDKLWMTARPLVERYFEEADWSQNDIVTSLMAELSNLDPSGQAARYYKSNKGVKHFEELTLLHIRHFANVAERLSEYLSDVLGTIGWADEERRGWEADMMQEYGAGY